jgi:hypothetical protein
MQEGIMMGKKGLIASSIALIKYELYRKDVNAEDYVKRKIVLYNQAKVLSEYQKQDDAERKKLLQEILL